MVVLTVLNMDLGLVVRVYLLCWMFLIILGTYNYASVDMVYLDFSNAFDTVIIASFCTNS